MIQIDFRQNILISVYNIFKQLIAKSPRFQIIRFFQLKFNYFIKK